MRQLHEENPAFTAATILRLARLRPVVLLSAILLGSPSASALPPASGSKCSSDWVNNAAAMACFIQGEEDLRNGVAHPHYVACTGAGEVFCCVDKAGGQDCVAVKVGGRGPKDIENLKVWAGLDAQRSILTILSQVSTKLDDLARTRGTPNISGGYGMGPGMMYPYSPGNDVGPGEMYGHGPRNVGGAALDLSDEQRIKIDKIQEELRRKQWDLIGKIHDEFASWADAPDDATADKIDDQIDQLRQQMMSNATTARKQLGAVLSEEQRRQLRRQRH